MMVKMDGSGTAEDPYRISCLEELRAAVRYRLDAHYRLISNISATKTKQQEFKPIGDRRNPFSGTFDGNNHKIHNLCIKQPEKDYVGLFGCLGDAGRVRNLGLVSPSITGRGRVGSFVADNYGEIDSSYVKKGHISGKWRVGGLVGYNKDNGEIESSYVQGGTVSGKRSVGGLVGGNYGIVVGSSVLKSDVSGKNFAAGLVGRNNGKVQSSYTVDSTVSGDKHAGDLLGNGSRESCFTMSSSNGLNIPEEPDLIMSRKDHRILYNLERSTLFVQVNGQIYSRKSVSPIEVQSLVDDETEVVKMTQKFMSSVVRTI